jgi:hypothetical protein
VQWLEIARWRDGLPELMLGVNTEHVRPRRPDLGKSPAADVAAYNEGCYSLGNLAVITAKENPVLNNRDFTGKLKVLRREARLFDSVRSVVYDEAGAERTEWTNAEISARAERLREQVWAEMMLTPPPR